MALPYTTGPLTVGQATTPSLSVGNISTPSVKVGSPAPTSPLSVVRAQTGPLSVAPPQVQPSVTVSNTPYYQSVLNSITGNTSNAASTSSSFIPTPAKVYAPKLDIASINSQARANAAAGVNPLYTKRLNDLLAQESTRRTQAQQDAQLAQKNIEDQLRNTTDANALTGNRVAQDVATNQEAINKSADIFQQDTGQAYDHQRIQAARQQAINGQLGTGQGNQTIYDANTQRNTAEGRQEEDFQTSRVAQALVKARTFEDIARSNLLASEGATKGKAAIKLNLDRLMDELDPTKVGSSAYMDRASMAAQQQQDLAQRTQQEQALLVNNFIASIRDPAKQAAAVTAYGGYR